MASVTFHVRGMDCAEEAATLRSALLPIAGVTEVTFNLLSATMTVTTTGERIPVEEVICLVEHAGLSAEQVADRPEHPVPETKKGNLRAALVALSVLITVVALLLHAAQSGWRAALSGHETGATPLARIIRMVSEAQSRRAPSEQWVERFARIYTPVVMCLALLVAAVPPLALDHPWSAWFYRSLVLLVIACPCALVISTPVTIVAALVSATRHGILIKGGLYVEVPAHLRAIALDKTGTLMEGKPRVQTIVPLSGHTERELLEIASAVEMRSQHPLAHAIVQHAANAGITAAAASDFQAIAGKGATASLNGRKFWIGSHALLEERSQETPELHDRLSRLSESGASVVVIGEENHVCGFISVSDSVRSEARETVAALKSLGIRPVVMLTGDNRGTAEAIAREADIDETHAELLPEAKVRLIEELVRRFRAVAMVGDGVNDAPAPARSSLGITMGAIGTDAAIETADIALMKDDLSRLSWLICHSRRALRTIRVNISASLLVKAAFVGLTLSGQTSLWAAIAADTGVSLLVVLNALRLLRDVKAPRINNHA